MQRVPLQRGCGHGPFSELEVLALYVAALGHDAGHFGLNNAYLQNSSHALYSLYPAVRGGRGVTREPIK
jgi:hypothetical protein